MGESWWETVQIKSKLGDRVSVESKKDTGSAISYMGQRLGH